MQVTTAARGANEQEEISTVNWDVSARERKLLEAERDAVSVCAVLVQLGCRVVGALGGVRGFCIRLSWGELSIYRGRQHRGAQLATFRDG